MSSTYTDKQLAQVRRIVQEERLAVFKRELEDWLDEHLEEEVDDMPNKTHLHQYNAMTPYVRSAMREVGILRC